MNRQKNNPWFQIMAALLCCMCCLSNLFAAEQSPSEPKEESHKNSAATWELQAQCVSKELGLTEEKGDLLSQTYVTARKSYRQALNQLTTSSDETENRHAKSQELKRQQDALKTALRGFLTDEQTEKAILSLGSFNPRWDHYVATISAFQLDDKVQHEALLLTKTYIEDYGKARSTATAESRRFSSVEARSLKATLDTGLAELVSKDQLAKWQEVTAFRSGGSHIASQDDGNVERKKGARKVQQAIE